MVHDHARQLDGVADVLDGAARGHLVGVRCQNRVHLDLAVRIEERAAASVECRVVLHKLDGGLHGVERCGALPEHVCGQRAGRSDALQVVVDRLVRDGPRTYGREMRAQLTRHARSCERAFCMSDLFMHVIYAPPWTTTFHGRPVAAAGAAAGAATAIHRPAVNSWRCSTLILPRFQPVRPHSALCRGTVRR